jgi:hypothetical protein
MFGMRRREFITLLGGTAATWPLGARAQQGERMRRIGVLMPYAESDTEMSVRISALEQGLQELGWVVGRNLRIDYRPAAVDLTRIRALANELVALKPDGLPWRLRARHIGRSFRGSGMRLPFKPSARSSAQSAPIRQRASEQVCRSFEAGQATKP